LGSTNPQQLLNKAQQIDIIKNRLPQPQQPFPQQVWILIIFNSIKVRKSP
jgi:hypothetical protein